MNTSLPRKGLDLYPIMMALVHWGEPAMYFDQQRDVRPQCLAHGAHIANDMLLVLAMDEAAPRPGERIPF